MINLCYVPFEEFNRVQELSVSPAERAALFATLCRINVLYMIKKAGSGHVGSSFSCIDILSWLFMNELRLSGEKNDGGDIYFSSKGHDAPALYSVLIGLGLLEFDLIHKLRRIEGLPGHPDVSIPSVNTNTGSLGMGISKAKGMALANRLRGRDRQVYVLTGDGELQEGQIWESLQPAANLALDEITVIVDHNKIQSDTWVSEVSDLGDLESKFQSFGWCVGRVDGHDLNAFGTMLAQLKSAKGQPKIIIADTIKGKGVSFMEHTAIQPGEKLYRFHSGAPDEASYTQAIGELIDSANGKLRELGSSELKLETVPHEDQRSADGLQRLISAYSKALVKQAERNPHIVALDADLVLDCGLIPFKEKFPDRFFECGIAEQDMVSKAGGMALSGLLPVVHSFASFLSARANEQIYNNATERTKIIYVGSLAGLLPGGPGHSHQCVRDISTLASVPVLILLEPSNEAELKQALDFCVNDARESCYLRLVSVPCEVPFNLPAGYQIEYGKGVAITDGDDAIVFGYGPVLLARAYYASKCLATRGIGLKVINLPWLNRVDPQWLRNTIAGYRWLFTLDNHYLSGGQGEFLLCSLAEMGLREDIRVKRFGVRDIPVCGRNDEVLRAHGLDSDNISQQIAAFIEGNPR